jgi:hypothetical protein
MDLLLFLFVTPVKSNTPRTHVYRTPGKSLAPPPRINTWEWGLKLCPIPGICAVTLLLFTNITLATGRLAEFGFLGVTIRALLTVPLTWGESIKAGVLLWAFFFNKVLLINWYSVDKIKLKKLYKHIRTKWVEKNNQLFNKKNGK